MTTATLRMDSIETASAAWRRGLATIGLALGCLLDAGVASAQSQPKADWSLADMPSQHGRIFLVTGGTSGMGYEDAKALAAAGARVVIAARNPQRGDEAIARIRREVAGAQVSFEAVDLANLASVRALGERLDATLPRLDGLINNAAIMAPAQRATSTDGYESQLATNYLGHFDPTVAMVLLTIAFYLLHYFFASATAHTTALLPVMVAAAASIPGIDMHTFVLLLLPTIGIMGIITPYGTGPSPVYYGSGYLPTKAYNMVGRAWPARCVARC